MGRGARKNRRKADSVRYKKKRLKLAREKEGRWKVDPPQKKLSARREEGRRAFSQNGKSNPIGRGVLRSQRVEPSSMSLVQLFAEECKVLRKKRRGTLHIPEERNSTSQKGVSLHGNEGKKNKKNASIYPPRSASPRQGKKKGEILPMKKKKEKSPFSSRNF